MGPVGRDVASAIGLMGLAVVGGALFGLGADDDGDVGFAGTPTVFAGGFVIAGSTLAGSFMDDAVSLATRRPGFGSLAGGGAFLLGIGAAYGAFAGVRALSN